MSSRLEDDVPELDLGDVVEFNTPDDGRVQGEVTRVYASRDDYHAVSEGRRYSFNRHDDEVVLVTRGVDSIVEKIRNMPEDKRRDLFDKIRSEFDDGLRP